MTKPTKKIIKVTVKSTKQYLRILNGMFVLTDKELDVLAAFIDKQKVLAPTGISIFSTEAKKLIAAELDMEHFNSLNVYIKRLKDKRALIYNDTYKINPILLIEDEEEGIFFKWQKKN